MNRRLHPVTVCVAVGAMAGLAMLDIRLLDLGLLTLVTCGWLASVGGLAGLRTALGWSVLSAAAIVLINPLVASYGSTILWSGPRIPVLGRLAVSLEELQFGLIMGWKVLLLTALACLYSRLQDADQALHVWGRFAPKTALTLIMASLMLPRLQRDVHEIRQALMARGARWTHGSWALRVRQAYPVFRILLLSSLEGSWQTAEALYARAFGSGRRTASCAVRWGRQDTLVVVLTMAGVLAWTGWHLTWHF